VAKKKSSERSNLINFWTCIIALLALVVSIFSCNISEEANELSKENNRLFTQSIQVQTKSLEIETEALKTTIAKNECDEAVQLISSYKDLIDNDPTNLDLDHMKDVLKNASLFRMRGDCQAAIDLINMEVVPIRGQAVAEIGEMIFIPKISFLIILMVIVIWCAVGSKKEKVMNNKKKK